MKDLTFDKTQKDLIKELKEFSTVEIIWDINAFYFNTISKTFKLECFDERPEGSNSATDEIFYTSLTILPERLTFEKNNSKFWYKIICSSCKINEIEYINVAERFPEYELVSLTSDLTDKRGITKSTIGLLIKTDQGFLPAFILPSQHGFHWQEKFDFLTKDEIDKLIADNIKHLEIKNCA